jgi:hypothetical protein
VKKTEIRSKEKPFQINERVSDIYEIPQSLKKAHFGMTALFRVFVTNN